MGHSTIKSFMMKAALAFAFYCIFLVSARRAPPSSQDTATEAATEAATTAAVDSSSDDAVQTLVKAYIDAGTCGQITTGDSCGDSAESYYSEFEYNGRRVVIANGIPNHDAEHLWTVAPVTVLLMDSTTTTPTSCAMLMLPMPVFVPRLDMPGMVFLSTDSAMMLAALSLPPVTASNQDILSLLSAWLLELSSLLSTTATMSLTVLETVTWMRPMVQSTQQLVSTLTLWLPPIHGFPPTTMDLKE